MSESESFEERDFGFAEGEGERLDVRCALGLGFLGGFRSSTDFLFLIYNYCIVLSILLFYIFFLF